LTLFNRPMQAEGGGGLLYAFSTSKSVRLSLLVRRGDFHILFQGISNL
jgi:hypothetical protein